jgi:hypothetical protein
MRGKASKGKARQANARPLKAYARQVEVIENLSARHLNYEREEETEEGQSSCNIDKRGRKTRSEEEL